MNVAVRNLIITELYDCYKANGFITEDEALSLFTAHNTPLHQIDSITEQLLTMGVIITADDDEDDELIEDRSRTDYEAVYNEILEICPGLEPTIEYLRNITRPLRNEWQKLMPQAHNGNEYARQRLFEMYLRVSARQALYLSKKYHLPLEDTIQDGFVGATSSVDNYNPAEHMSYATTIQWRINQSIVRNRQIYNNPTYFPVHMKDKLFDIMEEVEEHFCEYCSGADYDLCDHLIEKISRKYEWDIEEAKINVNYLKCWVSLDETITDGEELSDEGLFSDELCNALDSEFTATLLIKMLDGLKEREKDVILWRYGFIDNKVETLEEIGEKLSITRERVRQIEAKVLRKMRKIISLRHPDLVSFRTLEGSEDES